jgi:hypothetical protein
MSRDPFRPDAGVDDRRTDLGQVHAEIDRRFGRHLATGVDLLDGFTDVQRSFERVLPSRIADTAEIDLAMFSIAVRSSATFYGLRGLCAAGLSDQAAMLARPLYEDMLYLHWFAVEPDVALRYFEESRIEAQRLVAARWRGFPAYRPGSEVTTRLNAAAAQAKRSLRRPSMDSLAAHVETYWNQVPKRDGLEFFHKVRYEVQNLFVHTSGVAVDRVVVKSRETGERLRLRIGPEPDEMVLAWYGDGFWAFAQTLMLTVHYFELPLSADLPSRIALNMKILRKAPPSPAWSTDGAPPRRSPAG